MAIRLNKAAFQHAKEMIQQGKVIFDERDAWSEHQPSTNEENEFIRSYGFDAYAKWHLAVDDQKSRDTKLRYKFPYGDFKKVHRCALLSAESRAGQYKHLDIENAVAHLHGMIDESHHDLKTAS
jgi:hypothetical protein